MALRVSTGRIDKAVADTINEHAELIEKLLEIVGVPGEADTVADAEEPAEAKPAPAKKAPAAKAAPAAVAE